MIKTVIFDLDDTVLSSKHRQKYFDNGDLDLNHWREFSTYENIMQDKTLPLANVWREMYNKGFKIIVLTARVMGAADFHVLEKHGLKYHKMLSRNGISTQHFNLTDSLYKLRHVKKAKIDVKTSIMFDDNAKVKSVLREHGLKVLCAHKINKKLTNKVVRLWLTLLKMRFTSNSLVLEFGLF